ncbi:TnsA-like heteromeric transposase endonuclease subunit [Thermomonospora umbrina]|uniref:TnsA endonuclease-like protein n=1 Tax=Thermomonospora umbrina TaxID=111806 RepID=A0A3D9SV05_9ACTN|nr:TnsA-like heteromeric transposase endonuclease subunit [Thermomonospora umbrina]REE98330.1 hypothetical protein DFJ69_3817 [Thermomonospora umbrina]
MGVGVAAGFRDVPLIRSDRCGWTSLLSCDVVLGDGGRRLLDLADGWTGRWWARWKTAGADVHIPVRDLAASVPAGTRPVRSFTWSTRQRHRPGLAYLVSTRRHHGFESIAEQRVLLALDFAGELVDVLPQPFCLRFTTRGMGPAEHTPDFLAVSRQGVDLIDVRPAGRVRDEDLVKFAAAAEAALACGWRYVLVTGWKPNTVTTIDTLSSQRRPLRDVLGVQAALLEEAAAGGARTLAALVARTALPAVARAHLLHLLWHRRLGVDLARPLTDSSAVWPAGGGQES